MRNTEEKNINNHGITLIALVITIIILLILAGVSINAIIANNGILNKSTEAIIQTKKSDAKEQLELKLAELQTEYYLNNSAEQSNFGEWIKMNYATGNIEDYLYTITGSALPYTITLESVEEDDILLQGIIDKYGKVT